MKKYFILLFFALIQINVFSKESVKAENISNVILPHEIITEPAMCYASFVYETDCPDGVIYHYDIFVWGICYGGFYRDAWRAVFRLVLQIENQGS